ncbi:TerD family protein [Vibrio sp. 947]|uniref:TerD family protein n=1 Tax=unclassified Vibrio TaxID=2614977 RepID=UPI002964E5C3|nr:MULTISPECIES: TerD family protein [unclassified Vibrio]MDW1583517.1 TerD family protein [Vibrio sp. Vb2897]MDW1641879.1 TerD family protein [Vibrio sp. Vb2896]MDW1928110.1 TerD family protein [Vibrio sp. 947]
MQVINMSKGQRIDLSKPDNTPLKKIHVGLNWKERVSEGEKFDADLLVMLSGANGENLGVDNFVFYGNPAKASTCGAVKISEDNRDGVDREGEDDEWATVDLEALNPAVERISFAVNIFEAEARNQNFGIIEDCGIRIDDQESGETQSSYDLTEDYCQYTSVLVAEMYKKDGKWKFVAKGEGLKGGLNEFLNRFGFKA